MTEIVTIQVVAGTGYKKLIIYNRVLKGVAVKQYIQKLILRLNGFEIYRFVNREGYREFTDNNLDLPINGELEVILQAPDGQYEVMLLMTSPPYIIRPKSEGEYLSV